jgi:hypothetical protein
MGPFARICGGSVLRTSHRMGSKELPVRGRMIVVNRAAYVAVFSRVSPRHHG